MQKYDNAPNPITRTQPSPALRDRGSSKTEGISQLACDPQASFTMFLLFLARPLNREYGRNGIHGSCHGVQAVPSRHFLWVVATEQKQPADALEAGGPGTEVEADEIAFRCFERDDIPWYGSVGSGWWLQVPQELTSPNYPIEL